MADMLAFSALFYPGLLPFYLPSAPSRVGPQFLHSASAVVPVSWSCTLIPRLFRLHRFVVVFVMAPITHRDIMNRQPSIRSVNSCPCLPHVSAEHETLVFGGLATELFDLVMCSSIIMAECSGDKYRSRVGKLARARTAIPYSVAASVARLATSLAWLSLFIPIPSSVNFRVISALNTVACVVGKSKSFPATAETLSKAKLSFTHNPIIPENRTGSNAKADWKVI